MAEQGLLPGQGLASQPRQERLHKSGELTHRSPRIVISLLHVFPPPLELACPRNAKPLRVQGERGKNTRHRTRVNKFDACPVAGESAFTCLWPLSHYFKPKDSPWKLSPVEDNEPNRSSVTS